MPVQAKYYATGRAFYDDKDKWIEIDQEGVPGRVWDIADIVASRLLQAANVRGGYFAIDFIKSTLSGSTEQEILIREINMRDPMMVTEDEGVNDTRIQRHMLAELMARLAKRA